MIIKNWISLTCQDTTLTTTCGSLCLLFWVNKLCPNYQQKWTWLNWNEVRVKFSLFNWELKWLDTRFSIHQLVNECDDVWALNCNQDERGSGIRVLRTVSTSHTTWIDEVFAIVLSHRVLMGVPTDEDVTVKLSLNWGKSFNVAPRYDLVPMNQSNLNIANLYDLCLR